MSKLVMSNTMKSNTKRLSTISTSQDLQTRLRVVLPPTKVSNKSTESNTSISNPNIKTNDDEMNECDAPVSIRTRAHELNTRKIPHTTEVSNYGSCCLMVPDSPVVDVIA